MLCVASRFGYPNYRLSELSLVPISSDNRRSTVYKFSLQPLKFILNCTTLQLLCLDKGQKDRQAIINLSVGKILGTTE